MTARTVRVADIGGALPEWCALAIVPDTDQQGAPLFRAEFDVEELPTEAVLRSTFLGIGTVRVNGVVVGDEVLEPGWQSYRHRLVYRVHRVESLLTAGRNVIEAEVAPGWYAGRIGFFGQRDVYGRGRGLLAQLDVRDDGSWRTAAATGPSWTWRNGPIVEGELYDGEVFDARIPRTGTTGGERAVEVVPFDAAVLEERIGPPVRRIDELAAARIFRSPSGKVLVDFGRNIVGWVRLRAAGERGREITLTHAEVLEHGELGTRPLRSARATDRYILAGEGEEVWEPSSTYHGFRYVQVEGWPGGEPGLESLTAVVVASDMPRAGWFRTSHGPLAQLHRNVVASTLGNFVSIPTDCPQRDERLGWTGDIAVFAPTAEFLFDAAGFLRSWLRDVALEQRDDGGVPNFVPEIPFPAGAEQLHGQFGRIHPAVWGDATTLVPAALYTATGDAEHLRATFDTMRKWVDGVAEVAGASRLRDSGFQFGDWLDPVAPPDDPGAGSTDPALVATAYFAHSARLVAEAARTLGFDEERRRYDALADEVARAFRAAFVAVDGRMTSHSQTAYAIALRLRLLETERQRQGAKDALVALVREAEHLIGTGFVGTPLILDALTDADAVDDAYRMLLNEGNPSWLYAVRLGATTIWERWDSMLPDGSINPGEMTSFNHYALGAVADWMHRVVAGLAPAEPGYTRIRIAPRPRFPLRDAGATHLTPHGEASVDWEIVDDRLRVRIVVPPGVVAEVDLEGTDPTLASEGVHEFTVPAPRAYAGVAEVG